MYTVDMSKAASEWDSLREEARVLGAAIDTKLHALNKYSTTGPRYKAVDSSHFARSKRSAFIQDAQEVEDLLKQLEDANQKLEVLMYKKAGGSSDQHAVRRYHDVLKDYMHEFHRVREVVEKQMDREDLLGGSTSQDGDTFLNNRNRSSELLLQEHEHITNTERMLDDQIKNRSSELLLQEHEHITNTERMLDDQINLALGVKENLNHQQRRVGGAMQQLQKTMKKYPAINNLMQKIRMKKRKDTLVLAGVITVCLILLFLYSMR
uniref:Golgi SNAP receptor complex member 1 n=1 Tax=Panagrolaimus sp. ES5 TaxID=591445 RepID=A0AC34FGK8_9BILA